MSPLPVPLCSSRYSEDRGPGVHRRIDIAEVPLVGRNLAVGMQVRIAQHQIQLLLGKVGVDQRQSDSTWNARSQAAYHGYSHLSGMEMMSSLTM